MQHCESETGCCTQRTLILRYDVFKIAKSIVLTSSQRQAFYYAHTPIITSNDCEGAGEAFGVAPVALPPSPPTEGTSAAEPVPGPSHFFGRPAYLTVSSQLHLEALATSLSRVYTISPCFRAERSQTNRHLAEFWMLEAEWAFTKSVQDVCAVVEDVSRNFILDMSLVKEEMDVLWKDTDQTRLQALRDAGSMRQPWAHITYTDAVRELEKQQSVAGEFQFPPAWGKPLQSEHERWLAEKLVAGPVFVTGYPATIKPFYMRLNDDGRTVACFDLLIPGIGELVGGSLREERLSMLDEALVRHGLDKEEYGWYRDLRRFGGAPHGGFGMGFERLVSWMTGNENVRECVPMPRWAGRMLL